MYKNINFKNFYIKIKNLIINFWIKSLEVYIIYKYE